MQLTFEAIRGSSWNSDIAIDDIVLTSAACSKQQFKIVFELKLPPLLNMLGFLFTSILICLKIIYLKKKFVYNNFTGTVVLTRRC